MSTQKFEFDHDKLLAAYANIAAGVGIDVGFFYQFHTWIKNSGFMTDSDFKQLHGRGIPIRATMIQLFGPYPATFQKYSFENYVKAILSLCEPGAIFYQLIKL